MPTREPVIVTPATLQDWGLPEPGSDKESRGRLLVVGGSRETPGAVLLSGAAALRAGGGKLQIATVGATAPQLGIAVPEARVIGLAETEAGDIDATVADRLVEKANQCSAVLLGPGLVSVDGAVELLESVVPSLDTHVVVDALASAYLTEHPAGLRHLDGRTVLTVNPNELSRTLGWDEDRVDQGQALATCELAARIQAVVLCGGEEKTVATPAGECWRVQGGGPGLAVSGSGDVQSGIVTGLLARGAEPAQAAVWGAFVHARTGERLATEVGAVGFLARELLPQIPTVLTELRR